ncbi:MAG: nucleotidyl transferase AbiEii/AbiGii toxin family protein [Tannerella sp.]|jgi:predicted nucleotidyltransferase component of viral defense system|nr:nucleotidyl transferase AbiEii/AbiGii toxin family protein [Tannerella sp.]
MISLEQIQSYFPPQIRNHPDPARQKYMLKEYVQLLILDFLSVSPFAKKLVFIGDTNLRLVKGIDRFSEDLDFDCKDFSANEFAEMIGNVVTFLQRSGWRAETREKPNSNLRAYRSCIYFPELLFELSLSGYCEERFLVKSESQNQGVYYQSIIANIRGCGFYFPFPVPPDDILCSMKLSALLSRQKGRDFYDVLFLLAQTPPNYDYLAKKQHIHNWQELKTALLQTTKQVNLQHKSKDFEHLLFNNNSEKILLMNEFPESICQ